VHVRSSMSLLGLCLSLGWWLSGCVWLPDWPFQDTIVDDAYVEDDSRLISHCTPHAEPLLPLLIRRGEQRDLSCRIRNAQRVEWRFLPDDRERPILLAATVERLELHGDDLPWSPQPYGGTLVVEAISGGAVSSFTWQVVVAAHGDDLSLVAPSEEDDE